MMQKSDELKEENRREGEVRFSTDFESHRCVLEEWHQLFCVVYECDRHDDDVVDNCCLCLLLRLQKQNLFQDHDDYVVDESKKTKKRRVRTTLLLWRGKES